MTIKSQQAALDDLRVLDLSNETGQYCGKLLADMGADVIKVERPGGDPSRSIGPFVDDIPHPERSLYFWQYNTSKRSITLDIESAEGKVLFKRLITTADIVIETFPPGYLESIGLGYETLNESNGTIILASITPFGQWGPFRNYQASDLITLAMGGPMGVSGYDKNEAGVHDTPPIRGTGYQSHHIACHYATIASLIALEGRSATGIGQHIDVSMHESAAVCTETPIPAYLTSGEIAVRQTARHATINPSPSSMFPTKDGGYINMVVGGMTPEAFSKTVAWLDREGMAEDLTDPKYLDSEFLRVSMGHVMEVFRRFIATREMRVVWREAQEVGQTWAPFNAPEDLLEDQHLQDRGFFHQISHPELSRSITYPGEPYALSETPWRLSRRPPLVGEHNEEIYCGEFGMEKTQLLALTARDIM